MAGEATAAEIQELEQYLETSANAQHIKEIMEEIWHSPVQEVDTDLFYKRHMDRHRVQLGWTLKFLLRIACVLTGLTIAGYFIFSPKKQGDGKTIRPSEIAAAKGVRKTIHLPDGTTVWLNADSRLVYDEHMNERETRTVSLTGEAFFDVAREKDRPFIIHTPRISIRVLGTSFNVKAYPNDNKCEATLLKGSIELSVNNRPQQKIILRPSEKFALAPPPPDNKPTDLALSVENIKPVSIGDHNYVKETSWKDNRLVFDSETFKELKTRLERWYNVNIDIEGERINNYRFTGIFTTETIDQALNAMRIIKPFNYKMNNNEIIIY